MICQGLVIPWKIIKPLSESLVPFNVILKLDLNKIARARSKLEGEQGPMTYLLDRVRQEIEERFEELEHALSKVLIVDFKNGDLGFKSFKSTERISLLEKEGPPYFQGYDDSSFDCLVINLQMSWLDFEIMLGEAKRILQPGGVFYFSAFGPDTLGELAYAWNKVDSLPHVHNFTDMHFIGDALVRNGFTLPIVDTDWLTVEYSSVDLLMDDLKGEGFINILSERRKTLTGRNRFSRFKQELWETFNREEKLRITFELIYGFAKAPEERQSIRVNPPSMVRE